MRSNKGNEDITAMELKGKAASPGIAIGRAHVIRRRIPVDSGKSISTEEEENEEILKFEKAVKKAVREVENLLQTAGPGMAQEESGILETQIEFLQDPQLRDDVLYNVRHRRKYAGDALMDAVEKSVTMLLQLKDEYMSARADDLRDTGSRLLKWIENNEVVSVAIPEAGSILVGEEILPGDFIAWGKQLIAGIVSGTGSQTSHTAIISRAKEIPAVMACGKKITEVRDKEWVIVDGINGMVIFSPDEDALRDYREKTVEYLHRHSRLRELANAPAHTTDGKRIHLLANISGGTDLVESFAYGAEGAGLFRTELLFMHRETPPTEEEQFEYYKEVAIQSKGMPVKIRTMDIGGDKPVKCFDFPKEENPGLGCRGIRFSLDRKDIFLTQLRAILRASFFGNIALMFPMISGISELREAKKLLEEAGRQLDASGFEFNRQIKVGIMIEVPSAAITADILAEEVDFFSIGTNDLCQYTLAVDRGNEKISELYDPFNPALLRLLQYVVEQAHKKNIEVGICGEMAADPDACLLLVGMGLSELSMNASSIPLIKEKINAQSFEKASAQFRKVMTMNDSKMIVEFLKSQE